MSTNMKLQGGEVEYSPIRGNTGLDLVHTAQLEANCGDSDSNGIRITLHHTAASTIRKLPTAHTRLGQAWPGMARAKRRMPAMQTGVQSGSRLDSGTGPEGKLH